MYVKSMAVRVERRAVWRKPNFPPASTGFIIDLTFDPEDSCDEFLLNAGLSAKQRTLQPRRLYPSYYLTILFWHLCFVIFITVVLRI
jgi:hypothetical protein